MGVNLFSGKVPGDSWLSGSGQYRGKSTAVGRMSFLKASGGSI